MMIFLPSWWQLLRQLERHRVLKSSQHGDYCIRYFDVLVRLDLDQCREICVLAFPKSFLQLQGRQGLLPRRSLRLLADAGHKAWLLLFHDQQSIQVWQQGYLDPLEEDVTQNKIEIIQRHTKEVYRTFLIPHLNCHVLCQAMCLLCLAIYGFELAVIFSELQSESGCRPC